MDQKMINKWSKWDQVFISNLCQACFLDIFVLICGEKLTFIKIYNFKICIDLCGIKKYIKIFNFLGRSEIGGYTFFTFSEIFLTISEIPRIEGLISWLFCFCFFLVIWCRFLHQIVRERAERERPKTYNIS